MGVIMQGQKWILKIATLQSNYFFAEREYSQYLIVVSRLFFIIAFRSDELKLSRNYGRYLEISKRTTTDCDDTVLPSPKQTTVLFFPLIKKGTQTIIKMDIANFLTQR